MKGRASIETETKMWRYTSFDSKAAVDSRRGDGQGRLELWSFENCKPCCLWRKYIFSNWTDKWKMGYRWKSWRHTQMGETGDYHDPLHLLKKKKKAEPQRLLNQSGFRINWMGRSTAEWWERTFQCCNRPLIKMSKLYFNNRDQKVKNNLINLRLSFPEMVRWAKLKTLSHIWWVLQQKLLLVQSKLSVTLTLSCLKRDWQ